MAEEEEEGEEADEPEPPTGGLGEGGEKGCRPRGARVRLAAWRRGICLPARGAGCRRELASWSPQPSMSPPPWPLLSLQATRRTAAGASATTCSSSSTTATAARVGAAGGAPQAAPGCVLPAGRVLSRPRLTLAQPASCPCLAPACPPGPSPHLTRLLPLLPPGAPARPQTSQRASRWRPSSSCRARTCPKEVRLHAGWPRPAAPRAASPWHPLRTQCLPARKCPCTPPASHPLISPGPCSVQARRLAWAAAAPVAALARSLALAAATSAGRAGACLLVRLAAWGDGEGMLGVAGRQQPVSDISAACPSPPASSAVSRLAHVRAPPPPPSCCRPHARRPAPRHARRTPPHGPPALWPPCGCRQRPVGARQATAAYARHAAGRLRQQVRRRRHARPVAAAAAFAAPAGLPALARKRQQRQQQPHRGTTF